VLASVSHGRLNAALDEVDGLIGRYPNFRLAHLVRGDLLLARAKPIGGLGNTGHAAPERLEELRAEALARVRALDEAPRAGTVPRDLIALASLETPLSVFVSKSLAKKLGKRPALGELPWIAWAPPYDELPPNPQLRTLIDGFKPVFTSDNFLIQLQAAEAGVGAMILGRPPHRFSRPTDLVPLEISLGPRGISTLHLVCAKSALDVPRVRAVADLLIDEMKRLQH
jgi:DNA-binding transcriptional LysR family regulator